MNLTKKIAIVATVLVSISFGFGCTQQKKPLPTVPSRNVPPSTVTPAPRNVPPSMVRPGPNVPPTTVTPTPGTVPPASLRPAPRFNTAGILPNDANRIANRLAKKIAKKRYVNSATVIVTGSTAYVGLDIKANVERTKTNALKRDVINEVKRTEPRITTVTVASDPDAITRIKNIAQGIASGRPISAFTRELGEIGRRIIPSVR